MMQNGRFRQRRRRAATGQTSLPGRPRAGVQDGRGVKKEKEDDDDGDYDAFNKLFGL